MRLWTAVLAPLGVELLNGHMLTFAKYEVSDGAPLIAHTRNHGAMVIGQVFSVDTITKPDLLVAFGCAFGGDGVKAGLVYALMSSEHPVRPTFDLDGSVRVTAGDGKTVQSRVMHLGGTIRAVHVYIDVDADQTVTPMYTKAEITIYPPLAH